MKRSEKEYIIVSTRHNEKEDRNQMIYNHSRLLLGYPPFL